MYVQFSPAPMHRERLEVPGRADGVGFKEWICEDGDVVSHLGGQLSLCSVTRLFWSVGQRAGLGFKAMGS